jgi:hypothetical protein
MVWSHLRVFMEPQILVELRQNSEMDMTLRSQRTVSTTLFQLKFFFQGRDSIRVSTSPMTELSVLSDRFIRLVPRSDKASGLVEHYHLGSCPDGPYLALIWPDTVNQIFLTLLPAQDRHAMSATEMEYRSDIIRSCTTIGQN